MGMLDEDDSTSSSVDSTEENLRRMEEKLQRRKEEFRQEEAAASTNDHSSSSSLSSSSSASFSDSSSSKSISSSISELGKSKKRKKSGANKQSSTAASASQPPREIAVVRTERASSTNISNQNHGTTLQKALTNTDALSDVDFSSFFDDDPLLPVDVEPAPTSSAKKAVANSYAKKTQTPQTHIMTPQNHTSLSFGGHCLPIRKSGNGMPQTSTVTVKPVSTLTNTYAKASPRRQQPSTVADSFLVQPGNTNKKSYKIASQVHLKKDSDFGDYEVVEVDQNGVDVFRFFDTKNSFNATVVPGRVSLSPTTPIPTDEMRGNRQKARKQHQEQQTYSDGMELEDPFEEQDSTHKMFDIGTAEDERQPEINHSLYTPPPVESWRIPTVKSFTEISHPKHSRERIKVEEEFRSYVAELWRGKFECFNQMQSAVLRDLRDRNDHFVISAPTGSGKSTIFDIAMAKFFDNDHQFNEVNKQQPNLVTATNDRTPLSKTRKIVYVAPSKALCEERYHDWKNRLSKVWTDIEVAMITGDNEQPGAAFSELASAHLIVTTPEKFDSLSRRWTENFYLFASIKLFMIDEVHMCGDESRGWCIEAIVCRMKTIQRAALNTTMYDASEKSSYKATSLKAIKSRLRMVAVSATLPNIEDVAAMVGAFECYSFDGSYRPVKLNISVRRCGWLGKNQFAFWNNLEKQVDGIIRRYYGDSAIQPTIIFCHSKKEAERLASTLSSSRGERPACLKGASNSQLETYLQRGVGFHHAGLAIGDRQKLERGFLSGNIDILCATSTLAMGVNLPAHLVVIKGTTCWRGSGTGYQELDAATLCQMCGRAGRPGFHQSETATAIIMTDNASKHQIEKKIQGIDAAESHLLNKLPEVLNSEISQRVVTTTETALNWIKQTLLYARIRQNPQQFGLQDLSKQSIDDFLVGQCLNVIGKLKAMGLVETEQYELIPCPASKIMSANLVDFQAIEILVGVPYDASISQILRAISQIEGIQRPVRRSEKKKLNEVHKGVLFHLVDGPISKIRIQQPWEKVFVLLQCHIARTEIEDNTLAYEMEGMAKYAQRMLCALEEYSAKGSRNGYVAFQCLKLRWSLNNQLWSEHDGVLRKINGFDKDAVKQLRMKAITTFEHVLDKSTTEIAEITGKTYSCASELRNAVSKTLQQKPKMSASIVYREGTNRPDHIVCDFATHTKSDNVTYAFIAYSDRPGGCLMFKNNISDTPTVKFRCPETFGRITLHTVGSLPGLDDLVELKGPNDIGRSRFTESHFKNKCLVGSFPKKTHIQTKLIFQRQSGESAKTKDPQTGPATMKRSVESREAPVVGSSNKIARLSLTASSSRKQSAQQASMPAEETPVPEPTQQNLPGNGSSSDKSKKSNSIFFSWMNATPKTSTAASHNGSPVNGTSQRETPPLLHPQQPPRITREADPPIQAGHCLGIQHGPKQQSPVQPPTRSSQQGSLSQRISNVETARSAEPSLRRGTHLSPKEPPTAQLSGSRQQNSLSQHLRSSQGVVSQTSTKPQQGPAFSVGYRGQMASQVYADFAANSRIAFTPPVRTSTAFRSRQRLSSSSKKGSVTSWNHEKREQSKKQSRAFANRCDNPFSGFKHDPNDAELVLENLSSSNEKLRENNSLIPQQELQALRAVQRGFNRPVKKFRFDDRSRNKRHFRPSARELLASKAAEQEAYAAESSIAPLGREVSPIPPRRLAEAQQQTATPGNYSVVTDYANQQQQLRHPQNQVPMRQYGPPRGFSQHLSVPPEQHCGQIQVSHYCVQQFAGPEQRGNTQHDYQPQISHQGYGGYISQNQNPMIEDHHDHSDRNEFWDPTWNAENFPPEDRPEPQEAAMFQGKGCQFMQGQGSSSYAHPNGHVMQRTTQMPYHQPVHQMVPPLRRRANDESRPQASAAAEVTFERAFLD